MLKKLFSLIKKLFFRNKVYYVGGSQSLPPPLTGQEEEDALKGLKEGDSAARSKLIEHNYNQIRNILLLFHHNYS